MKSTGMVRAVDKMGRVVIPKEIRKQLKVENEKVYKAMLDEQPCGVFAYTHSIGGFLDPVVNCQGTLILPANSGQTQTAPR